MSEVSSGKAGMRNRPLSPHLSIYKPIPTMMMSIFHRITGVALYFGMFLFAWWLFAAATHQAYFEWVNGLFTTWIGRIVLLGFTWALIHHLLGGVKHLVQDTGRAMEKNFTTKMAKYHIVASIILTVLLWVAAYAVR
ncbi:MAG: succinate dehydrogenase, cytochrome b556 subunit [Salaquimonas sp.]